MEQVFGDKPVATCGGYWVRGIPDGEAVAEQ